ncbi:MAG: Ig-like domain-containing protein [Trueperaceae bacterium]|nr:Ig-like domain-containing protein [Trueperaceae bacterium]
MKQLVLGLMLFSALFLSSAWAQVASAEILGVDETRPHSVELEALRPDGSVGEVIIRVRALDGSGNPVAGAPVSWLVKNSKTTPAYVVGSSASMAPMLGRAYAGADLSVDGGVTDENGEAYLVVDARTSGDTRVAVNVGGMDAKTYDGNDMRIVWF